MPSELEQRHLGWKVLILVLVVGTLLVLAGLITALLHSSAVWPTVVSGGLAVVAGVIGLGGEALRAREVTKTAVLIPAIALGAVLLIAISYVAFGTQLVSGYPTASRSGLEGGPLTSPMASPMTSAQAVPLVPSKPLAISKIWPFTAGCEGQIVAVPPGKGDINDFHTDGSLVKVLIENGGGSWGYGQVAVDFSAAPSTSVAILRVKPNIVRRDLAPPAWLYTPRFGCGPTSADRHFEFHLDPDPPTFMDKGVAVGGAGPSNGPAPTAALGPDFVISGDQHARIRIDALACRGNYSWNVDIDYSVTGKEGVQTETIGLFSSYGLADGTTDYLATYGRNGHAQVSSQSVLTGALADSSDKGNPCRKD